MIEVSDSVVKLKDVRISIQVVNFVKLAWILVVILQ